MRGTYRFGCHSLIAPRLADDRHERSTGQPSTAAHVPRRTVSAARSPWAQRTVALAAAVLGLALFCAASALAEEPWSRDARTFHADGFAEGVTTQSLAGGGLTPDPLAPDAGTVAYVIHTKGQAWAAVVVYDPTTRRYRQVCGLVGPFESASDIRTFDPLLRSVLSAVHERGFPARVIDYTPDVRTIDLAQYGDDAPPPAMTRRTPMPQPSTTISATLPPPSRQPLTAQETLIFLGVAATTAVLLLGGIALILNLSFRHREQMAVVRTATRPPQPSPRPTPRPTAVPTPTPVAKQGP